jgi:hypothetical protein
VSYYYDSELFSNFSLSTCVSDNLTVFEDVPVYKNLCQLSLHSSQGRQTVSEISNIIECYGSKTGKGKREWERGTGVVNRLFDEALNREGSI